MYNCKFSFSFIGKHFILHPMKCVLKEKWRFSSHFENYISYRKYHNMYLFNQRHKYSLFLENRSFCTIPTTDEFKSPISIVSDELDKNLLPRSLRVADAPHQIFIIQPVIKWGKGKRRDVSPEILCEEAESLIKTLNKWKVVQITKISLLSFDKKTFFNKGQLKDLNDIIKNNSLVTGVFINVSSLKLEQHLFLEEFFNVPVFDRYSIVISIFKQHAITKEAKLQVALAEIPYVRSRIKGVNVTEPNLIVNNAIGSPEIYSEKRLKFLNEQERKIKKSIENLKKNRDLLRSKRKTLQFPVVAVVGYTNAGKTSLIKCLTNERSMEPEDKLFATLDVTAHEGLLPCNLKVLYIDTIGFIADIPTNLLEPFVATLEDAIQADVILHVQDVSHPNLLVQSQHVLKTLKGFNLKSEIIDNIITVGNKCDKTNLEETTLDSDVILVSCVKNIGLTELKLKLEESVCRALNMIKLRMRVSNGGQDYCWLHKEAAVFDINVDEDNQQYVFLDVMISKIKFEKFKRQFVGK